MVNYTSPLQPREANDQDDIANLQEKLWSIDEYVSEIQQLTTSADFANMTAIHVAGPYLVSPPST